MNFGLLTAEIRWRVWGTPVNFDGFRVLAALLYSCIVSTIRVNKDEYNTSSACSDNMVNFGLLTAEIC